MHLSPISPSIFGSSEMNTYCLGRARECEASAKALRSALEELKLTSGTLVPSFVQVHLDVKASLYEKEAMQYRSFLR